MLQKLKKKHTQQKNITVTNGGLGLQGAVQPAESNEGGESGRAGTTAETGQAGL
jgi:hypothetical protein